MGQLSNFSTSLLFKQIPDNPGGPDIEPVRKVRRRQYPHLQPAIYPELITAYLSGMSLRQVGESFGVNRTTVSRILNQVGIARRGKKLGEKEVSRAIKLYESGLSLAAVGRALGVKENSIRHQFKKAGVKIRPKRGSKT